MVVELAVSGATIFASKYLQFLILRPKSAKHLLRVFDRYLLIILPVCNKEWAGNALCHWTDLKLLDAFHRRIHGVRAGDVHQLKHRGRDGSTGRDPAMPNRVVVVICAPGDDGPQTRLEGRRARHIISTQTAADNADTIAIDIIAGLQVVDRGANRKFIVIAGVALSDSPSVANPRRINGKAIDAACGEFVADAQVGDFLSGIQAAKEHGCRLRAGPLTGRNEIGR